VLNQAFFTFISNHKAKQQVKVNSSYLEGTVINPALNCLLVFR